MKNAAIVTTIHKLGDMTTSTTVTRYRISDTLQLVRVDTLRPVVTTERPATHHVIALDCSGSMAGDLPRIREQLKSKLPKMLGEQDEVSIVWFSGRGECGALVKREKVPSLRELGALDKTIDRWIRPVGLTGFVEPLKIVSDLLSSGTKGIAALTSLFMMSDGCDNQWSRTEIMSAVGALAGRVDAATFVEYGYYADKKMLAEMASQCGGKLIFADSFDKYEPEFENAMTGDATPQVVTPLPVQDDVVAGIAFAFDASDGRILQSNVEGSQTRFPERIQTFFYLTQNSRDSALEFEMGNTLMVGNGATRYSPLHMALSVLATRGLPDVIYPILGVLGDIAFTKQYTGLFGKQAYTRFQTEAAHATANEGMRFTLGYSSSSVPRDDAFTVMDLLTMLQASDARILFEDPSFKYSRIGRKRLDNTETDTPQLKFVRTPDDGGTPCNSLVINSERANVSVNVRHNGHVDLSGRLPKGDAVEGATPLKFPTHQFRSYTIVKDGLVNVSKLPLMVSHDMLLQLSAFDIPMTVNQPEPGGTRVVIDLDLMPIIDRRDVTNISARTFLDAQWRLEQSRCAQKVYKFYRDEATTPAVDMTFAAKYGSAAAEWLSAQGFSSSGGYAPPHTKLADPGGDYYLAKIVECNIPGFSKLPSVKDAIAGKGSVAGRVMRDTIDECERRKASMKPADFARWVTAGAEMVIMETRTLLAEVARMVFSVILSQRWFDEFQTIGDGSLELPVLATLGSKKTAALFEMREEKVML